MSANLDKTWELFMAARGDDLGYPDDVAFVPDEEWAVFRYEDVSRVFRDQKQFSSEGYNETIGLVLGPTILGMMGSPHREHRNLVAHAFKERSLQRWEPEFIAPVCHQLIDEVIEEGRADLVRALTFEFPVRVIVKIAPDKVHVNG